MHDERSRFGALPLDAARTAFRLWAPSQRRVRLETEDGDRFALAPSGNGAFEAVLPLPCGTGYRYLVDQEGSEQPIADPASREQRQAVDGFSVVVDPGAYAWQHAASGGRPWRETVIWQFDAAVPGGFDALAERLPALASSGVTAVGLLPVARSTTTGRLVLPFAPDASAGRPDDLRRLVDLAHGLGLAVVVGTADSPLEAGESALDDLGPGSLQAFVAACAVQWIVDYRVDGLWIGPNGLPDGLATVVRKAAGPHRRVRLLWTDAGRHSLPPPGFDARWNADASQALADLRVADAGRLSRALASDVESTEVIGVGSAAEPAALGLVLLSPRIPLIRDDGGTLTEPLRRLVQLRAERLAAHLPGSRVAGVRTQGGSGVSEDLAELAERAGVGSSWSDQAGRVRTVARETVLRVLDALGHPCDSPAVIAASLAALKAAQGAPAMLTARVGETVVVPLPAALRAGDLRATATLESGETRELLPAIRPAEATGSAPALVVDGFDVPGYHRLELVAGGWARVLTVAVAPRRAFDAGLRHAWGTSVQLHALRPESTREFPDPGLGDFSALAAFGRDCGAAGAQVLAISPTHAGFAADASSFSPYSPSSRLFHNVLFIDPLTVFGADAARQAAAGIDLAAGATHECDGFIDWPAAAALKLRWLRALFDRHRPGLSKPADDALRLHATFEALHAHFHPQGLRDWRRWPEAYQDPESAEVAAFAEAQADDVRFHAWLQQLAEVGLEAAQRACRGAGMRVGLVSDLAIGMSGAGSHAWASRRDLLVGLEIGAPPDSMNPRGQSWGLTAFSPQALAERRFEPFLQTLRAAMRQTGGVRIDHVLGLNRLWLVPAGLPATEGAYVRYPMRDFFNLLILESHRQRAIVIGEDLGTVPDGFREALADAGVLGMAVLWLERTSGPGFRPPAQWSADAVAMTTTHDLPTAAGWWKGRDIDWRERIGTEPDVAAARRLRETERAGLAALAPEVDVADDGVDLAIAAVLRAPAALVLVPIEDLLGLVEQPNLPGTVDEHPNWRRRLPAAADRLLDDDAVRARLERLRNERS